MGPVYSALVRYLEDDHRLEMRAECPDAWRALMSRCWLPLREPGDRPSLAEILQVLE